MKTQKENGFAHIALLFIALIMVGLVGFVGIRALRANSHKSQVNSGEELTVHETLPATLESILPFDDVKGLATKNTDASITDFELENEDGTLIYKVTLSDGKVLSLNARTGVVMREAARSEDSLEGDEQEEPLPKNFTIFISFEKAREVAQAKFPNGKIVKIELDVETGVVVLSVRFADQARVDVNASTGEVVRTKNPELTTPVNGAVRGNDSPASTADDSSKSVSSNPGPSGSGTSGTSGSGGSDSSGSGSSSSSGNGSGSSDSDNEIRVEGTLVSSNGNLTVTVNGTVYTIHAGWDIRSLIGKSVRVEGTLSAGNAIEAEKVDQR